ncbi:glycosyl transferase family 11 [Thioclava sp. ES.031]|uniref:alpha-1,2-fucosyltransferase n=1 Tax=Thioclava sp. ES.031 TaxID=1798203 RepID=UPI000C0199D4|nr:alpha-1,2-fucosyltransferase [Thioclava sp. ES.031]PFG62071.1 glycosyl transferase family 11 [Thioclava sp. ES.031]
MILANLIGGLGNQMFQYACATALARETGQELRFCVDGFSAYAADRALALESVFGIALPRATQADLAGVIGGWRSGTTMRRLLARPAAAPLRGCKFVAEKGFSHRPDLRARLGDGGYLHGYWQSERYFNAHAAAIRDAFRFSVPLEPENQALAARIAAGPAIGLHVRRGDYLNNAKVLALHGLCNPGYYREAIARLQAQHPEAKLFAFSDDPDWVEQQILNNLPDSECVRHNGGQQSYRDMQMMALCDHQIIANSSFSWWAAWLNPKPHKRIIAPRQWFADPSLDASNIVPQEWERL